MTEAVNSDEYETCSEENGDFRDTERSRSRFSSFSDAQTAVSNLIMDEESKHRYIEHPFTQRLVSKSSSNFNNFLFMIISFGYMLPWTSLGSLISYYKYTYSASFYVKLYCAYYLPGLPVALLQNYLDRYLDARFGSYKTYLFRGGFAYIFMIAILLSLVWAQDSNCLIFLFAMLGICGWLCHGTASMLASMYPPSTIAYLQTGFRCPEIYTVIIVSALNIGKSPARHDLNIFFVMTAIVVSTGLWSWIYVINGSEAQKYFESKDRRLNNTNNNDDDPEIEPLTKPYQASESNEAALHIQPHATAYPIDSKHDLNHTSIWSDDPHTKQKVTWEVEVYRDVKILCIALFVTMFCSIFQAAFFAFVDSKKQRNIEQILYFVRLFCDLLGRPLTRLKRPWFLKKKEHVLKGALLRVLIMVVFFLYISVPSFPQSDFFIIFIVAIFSVLAGYFTVLIYEFACKDYADEKKRTFATSLLNISFQLAAFTSVISSVYVTNSQWFVNMIYGEK